MNRRDFIRTAAACVGGLSVSGVQGQWTETAKKPLRVALIGCGDRGCHALLPNIATSGMAEFVAFVDPDARAVVRAQERLKKYRPDAKTGAIAAFGDYRDFYMQMAGGVDAVFIATPNHQHCLPALLASRNGIHAYVEKPMAYTVEEGRRMLAEARAHRVATQMGQHGHSNEGARRLCEYVWAGAVGQVTEVYCWTDRVNAREQPLAQDSACPKDLDWDKWIGPAAWRGFNGGLHPVGWYSWRGFGSATIGNMGNHVIDPVFWALKLGSPESVQLVDYRPGAEASWGLRDHIVWKFPKRGDLAPVEMHWFDGLKGDLHWDASTWTPGTYKYIVKKENQNLPPKLVEIEKKYSVDLGRCASVLIGEKGILCISVFGESLRLVPDSLRSAVTPPPKTIPRIRGSHQADFMRACLGGPAACANFEYSQPLNELMLLGVAAIEEGSGKRLDWDGKTGRFTHDDAANKFLSRPDRAGWGFS